jgi:hypothetical protein
LQVWGPEFKPQFHKKLNGLRKDEIFLIRQLLVHMRARKDSAQCQKSKREFKPRYIVNMYRNVTMKCSFTTIYYASKNV